MLKANTSKLALIMICTALLSACNGSDDDNDKDTNAVVDSVVYSDAHHIVLDGEDNFRDLGGYEGADGKKIVSRKLFRSGELSKLTDNDRQVLTDLGIEYDIDLRTDSEIANQPDAVPDSIVIHQIALSEDTSGGETQTGSTPEDLYQPYYDALLAGNVDDFMLPAYAVDDFKVNQWTQIFALIQEGKATLWHCTAGQDRAGMTAALVLESLGVDRDTIYEDYLKSNEYTYDDKHNTAEYIYQQADSPADSSVDKITQAELIKKEYLDAFYSDIALNHGGMENFLNEIGVDIETMRTLYLN
ncbi:MAG: tyrosine-protein phosphatase [Vibrio sp.]